MTSTDHNRLAGIFLLVHALFQLAIFALICLLYALVGVGLILGGDHGEDKNVGAVFVAVVSFIFALALIFMLPQVIVGWKMYKGRLNARIWGIIASILACMSFPIGTAAGVYGLWFLFGEEGKQFYLYRDRALQPPAPAPGSWQR